MRAWEQVLLLIFFDVLESASKTVKSQLRWRYPVRHLCENVVIISMWIEFWLKMGFVISQWPLTSNHQNLFQGSPTFLRLSATSRSESHMQGYLFSINFLNNIHLLSLLLNNDYYAFNSLDVLWNNKVTGSDSLQLLLIFYQLIIGK